MYKIYINSTEVNLISTEKLRSDLRSTNKILVAQYTGKSKHLLNFIDMCEKTTRYRKIVLHYQDKKQLVKDFKKLFKTIKASGGIVFNEYNEALLIHRKKAWDLPKGKIEKGEKKKAAAIREVEEETGIENIEVIEKVGITNHTYRSKTGERLIKKSFWYLMKAPKQRLIPQADEDIEKAEWMSLDNFFDQPINAYDNILDILRKVKPPEQ